MNAPNADKRTTRTELHNLCLKCRAPLWVRYDLDRARTELDRDRFATRPAGLWRWAELLPIDDLAQRIDLGEGGTPLLRIDRLASQLGLREVWLKDEGRNPTGSFKARGMATAVTQAKALGVREFVVPTAGNAGGAAAAYAARAGMAIHVYMPKDAPPANINECRAVGADVHLLDGLINDAGPHRRRRRERTRLVRSGDTERAISCRGQEDDGL